MKRPIGVVGGGSFGWSLVRAVARRGFPAVLWSRRPQAVLPEGVVATTEWADLHAAELIFVAVPSVHVREVAPDLGRNLDGRHLLVHVSRGLVGEDLLTVGRHLSVVTPCRRVGCLAGPINPEVLASAAPGGGVIGTGFPALARAVREALGGVELRLYETDDITGVEVASALVGLLAMAAGFGLESRVSPAALAVMTTRGLAEAARVGEALGGRQETFFGMAGAGDLFAAVAGDERAEVRLGRALARNWDLQAAGKEAGAHIEGLTIARRVASFATRMGVHAPIATVIADVIDGEATPEEALLRLMER